MVQKKQSMNNEWKDYINRQIDRGVSKDKLKDILEKQNYSPDVINNILYIKKNIETEIQLNLEVIKNVHFKDPIVETYTNFLSDEECQHFIDISKGKFKRAYVSSEKGEITTKGRTGLNTWIQHNHSEITKNVAERISKIVNIPLENAESFQIIYYGKHQEYRIHYDSWEHDKSEKTLRCMKYGGARLMTALCYLNNVSKGGGTKFSKLNTIIPAEKRKLLVFQNTNSKIDHNRHPLSEHAGMPIEEGEKYAFNLWFRECSYKTLYKDFNPDYYN